MFEQIAVWRLRRYAEECGRAKHSAVEPLTRHELAQFESLFQKRAADAHAAHQSLSRDK